MNKPHSHSAEINKWIAGTNYLLTYGAGARTGRRRQQTARSRPRRRNPIAMKSELNSIISSDRNFVEAKHETHNPNFISWKRHVTRQLVRLSSKAAAPSHAHRLEICCLLWPPYGIGQAIVFLPCGFLLSSIFLFPRLISAAADRMSTILLHMVWP